MQSGPTEETPATPSWVEDRLDEIRAALPSESARALRAGRDGYLDCLAASAGPGDPMLERQRCHQTLIDGLRMAGLPTEVTVPLHQALEALEAELGERS